MILPRGLVLTEWFSRGIRVLHCCALSYFTYCIIIPEICKIHDGLKADTLREDGWIPSCQRGGRARSLLIVCSSNWRSGKRKKERKKNE